QALVLLRRPGRLDEREHLDLVELVDAEDAARVAAGGAGLAPEAGGEAGVAQRQLLGVEDLAGVQGRQRDLRGADEEEVVLGYLVDLVAIAGQESRPVESLFANQDGWDDRLVALAADEVDREADQRQLEQDEVALYVGEAGAGELRRRLHVDQAELGADLEVIARLEVEARPLPLLAQDDGVLLGHPVGDVGIGKVGKGAGEAVELGLDLLQLGFARLDPLLQALYGPHLLRGVLAALLRLADLLGERLALGLSTL